MATTIEALIAAVHRDGGDEAMAKLLVHLGLIHELLKSGPNILSVTFKSLPYLTLLIMCIHTCLFANERLGLPM